MAPHQKLLRCVPVAAILTVALIALVLYAQTTNPNTTKPAQREAEKEASKQAQDQRLAQVDNKLISLTADVNRYRDELKAYKQAYSDLTKLLPATGAIMLALVGFFGWNVRTWRAGHQQELEHLQQDAKQRLDTMMTATADGQRLEEQRSDLILRSLRYIVEKARSDLAEVPDATQDGLTDVYYGLGLFACDIKDVRAAVKALCVQSSGTTPLQWLNEIRSVWTERRRLEHNMEKTQEIDALLHCIDDAITTMLKRIALPTFAITIHP